jgi:hypothetical protein
LHEVVVVEFDFHGGNLARRGGGAMERAKAG